MSLTADLIENCDEQNRSSLGRIFISSTCDIIGFTPSAVDMSFTAITVPLGKVFVEYEAEFETKGLNIEGANENGTATFTNTAEIKILGLDKIKLKRLQDLVDTRKLTLILETVNSSGTQKKAFVLGWDAIIGKDAKAQPVVNGVIEPALDGDNSLTVIFTAKHAELIREYVGAIATLSSGTINFGA